MKNFKSIRLSALIQKLSFTFRYYLIALLMTTPHCLLANENIYSLSNRLPIQDSVDTIAIVGLSGGLLREYHRGHNSNPNNINIDTHASLNQDGFARIEYENSIQSFGSQRTKDLLAQSDQLAGQTRTEITTRLVEMLGAQPNSLSPQAAPLPQKLVEFQLIKALPVRLFIHKMSPEEHQNMAKKFELDYQMGFWREAAESAEVLRSQINPKLRRSANQVLGPRFRDGVFLTNKIRNQSPGPFETARVKLEPLTLQGQSLRRMMNSAQIQWVEDSALERRNAAQTVSYLSAVAAIREAEQQFEIGHIKSGSDYLNYANQLLLFSRGFVTGAQLAVESTLMSLPHLAKSLKDFGLLVQNDPYAAGKQLYHFALETPVMVGNLVHHYADQLETIASGQPNESGQALGGLVTDISIGILMGGATSVAAKATHGAIKAIKPYANIANKIRPLAPTVTTKALKIAKLLTDEQRATFLYLANKRPDFAIKSMQAAAKLPDSIAVEYFGTTFQSLRSASSKGAAAATRTIEAGALQTLEQWQRVRDLIPLMNRLPDHVDIRYVGTSNKLALIGQDMKGNVLQIKARMNKLGYNVETFELSKAAKDAFEKLLNSKNLDKIKSPSFQRKTPGYIENKQWTEYLIRNGYTILDSNNPLSKPYSIFYHEAEREIIRKAMQISIPNK